MKSFILKRGISQLFSTEYLNMYSISNLIYIVKIVKCMFLFMDKRCHVWYLCFRQGSAAEVRRQVASAYLKDLPKSISGISLATSPTVSYHFLIFSSIFTSSIKFK